MTQTAPFRKVLVANRGEIAVRIIRTCKRLGIESVAVYSEADARALHVRMADHALPIGASRPVESYLRVDALLRAIEECGADAVHPGYGLLSEDPTFAAAVRGARVTFVGPSRLALETFGDKIRARRLAAEQGLAHPPGTAEPVSAADIDRVQAEAQRIGYPVLVKAAAGGGGIGMQRVPAPDRLLAAISACSDRGRAAFGDDRVYLEKWLERPRHIEVQVVADVFGKTLALGDRECSVQRRHQKVIEESPCPAALLSGAVRQELYRKAEALLEATGYVGVGTVEFIADGAAESAQVYFLEVNARLQVEHPVTEAVTGIDLVEVQLRLARGEPLAAVLAAAGLSALFSGTSPLSPPALLSHVAVTGHAVEARLYAEDPARGFLPQPGRVERFEVPLGPGMRLDSGYEAGDEITPFYDPLIAKVIAHGGTREEAITRLSQCLAASRLQVMGPKGPRATNLEFLVRALGSARFLSGDYDTLLVAELLGEAGPP